MRQRLPLPARLGPLGALGVPVGPECRHASLGSEDAAETWRVQSGDELESIAVLGRLFVIREARSMSAGKALVRAAQDWAARQQLTLVLDVMEKDKAATRLYERLGWRRIGEAVHDAGEGEKVQAACYVAPREHCQSKDAQDH